MKFTTKLVFLCLILLSNNLFIKESFSLKVLNSEKSKVSEATLAITSEELQMEETGADSKKASAGLMRFATRAFENDSITKYMSKECLNTKEKKEGNKSICRDVFQKIAISYDLSKKVSKMVSFKQCRENVNSSECSKAIEANITAYKSIYLLHKVIEIKEGGISRFVLGFTPHNDEETSNEVGETYLFKICIPYSTSNPYYIDFRCPLDECDDRFDPTMEIKQCREPKVLFDDPTKPPVTGKK